MRLLRCGDDGELSLTNKFDSKDTVPPYAILSHTWGSDIEEVTFEDVINGCGKNKPGYEKIKLCGEQARRDGLTYFWVDTCCIDKVNKGELSKAINSMFGWYRNSTRCYAYLSDVSISCNGVKQAECNVPLHESDFRKSRWFTRGWTLQELLAPNSVEFFSQEWKRLGDKVQLQKQIHEVTGIPDSALQGEPLAQFGVEERLSWNVHRQTKLEEDRVYSLLGIFDVYISPFYGEGASRALERLKEEINKRNRCMEDLRPTDPRDDKKRIEGTKGGLIKDSYNWILDHPGFQEWRNNNQSRLLWIKGDPGKGKTMLLCGIINELQENTAAKTDLVSYFFCQATDLRINNATAVLRGLMYMLLDQQPALISHMRKKYDHAGKALFEDVNSWVALSEIFTNILKDPALRSAYLIVDALDECATDLPNLLDFIVQKSSVSSRHKWIISSRNESGIERRLQLDKLGIRLSLEHKENAEQVSQAVNTYIDHCLSELTEIQDDKCLHDLVRAKMQQKANGTFLWVSLLLKELKQAMAWEVLRILDEVPSELTDVYHRMMEQIKQSKRYSELCRQILSTIIATYRPLLLRELHILSGLRTPAQDAIQATTAIVKMCGSFLTIRNEKVYVIHQSAREFLSAEASHDVFPNGVEAVHYSIFSRSLQALSGTLRRNMYNLGTFDSPTEQINPPDPDPLAPLRYSCIYWIDHLCTWNPSSSTNGIVTLQAGASVDSFIRTKYLYWLEALSLCDSMSLGVISMTKLETLLQETLYATELTGLVQDARRFILYHKAGIERSPLQAYTSALLFSPKDSQIRTLFEHEEPKNVSIRPAVSGNWSACLQTLEGHERAINSVAFSYDSTKLASASNDCTIRLWDAVSGDCFQTLEGHFDIVTSVAFSPDSTRLASASGDYTVRIWHSSSGKFLQKLEGHGDSVATVAFSPDSSRLVSASYDRTVRVWDASSSDQLLKLPHTGRVNSAAFSPDSTMLASAEGGTIRIWAANNGALLKEIEGHSSWITSVVFSADSARLASSWFDGTVRLWDVSSGDCIQVLEGHTTWVSSVAFSPDATRLASASEDRTVRIWDADTGDCLQVLEGHVDWVRSVAFSPSSSKLASASVDCTVKVWDTSGGDFLQTLKGHSDSVTAVTLSRDSTRLASASVDGTVGIWDACSGECLRVLEGHSKWVRLVLFSSNSTRLVSASDDGTMRVWDVCSGDCLQVLKGHIDWVRSMAFSQNSARLASASGDNSVMIWDADSGDCLQVLKGHSSWVSSVAFSPDSTKLASASGDRTVRIWNANSGECLQTLEGHRNWVRSVVFSHDSTKVASASDDCTVRMWNASNGDCIRILEGHTDWVNSLAFSSDSTRLASASGNHTARIWDASSGACLFTFYIGRTLRHISFDPTNSYLRTETGTINIGTLSNSKKVRIKPKAQSPQYQGLALSADGVWITYNSTNLLWLPPEYRPSCSEIGEGIIGFGVGTGRVWMCKVV